jgi:ATP-dependent helicase/nuclease subunit A
MTQAPTKSAAAEATRALDPNVVQRKASDPRTSVWVGASAGSGKTKVLTDRVLRLLLPGERGQPGTPPHKILCLTFTKVAARDMAIKINQSLSRWAIQPDVALEAELKDLLGRPPTEGERKAARRLFADVVDAPGSLNIQTIHAFCHSVLSRFPLEAGLPVTVRLVQEREAKTLLLEARDYILEQTTREKTSILAQAINDIAAAVNDEQFLNLMEDISARRSQLRRLLSTQPFGADGLYNALCSAIGIMPEATEGMIRDAACTDDAFDRAGLKQAADALAQSTDGDKKLASGLYRWLEQTPTQRAYNFKDYLTLYFTKEMDPRSKIISKSIAQARPDIGLVLEIETKRIVQVLDSMRAAACALLTRSLLRLGHAIEARYTYIKQEQGLIDFDDLIEKTSALLRQDNMASWVMYKLDQGIDHILVDEAQDTNPDQWQVIDALCAEFTTGMNAQDAPRTVFVVGDEKQSIYSFQGASPGEFRSMSKLLERRFEQTGHSWERVPLNISFRSTPSVLRAVDATFSLPALRQGVSEEIVTHTSHRRDQAGHVELWPLIKHDVAEEIEPWEPPVDIIESQSPASQLAEKIASTVAGWIGHEMLPSRGRTVQPEDILILVRTRNAFFSQLAMALKKKNVPVSGIDRMILQEQIGVQDLLALAEFSLLPGDDLSLACLLKSPLLGWSEDQLYDLAAQRKHSLWAALCEGKNTIEKTYLEKLIAQAGTVSPYVFFSHILQEPCPASPVSGLRAMTARLGNETIDPLDELLNSTLEFEQNNIPSLQEFLYWQSREQSEIKREMDEPRNEVRIMTVHGSKGLQAPIVILPDTIQPGSANPKESRLLWPDQSGLPAPFWTPRADMACAAYTHAQAQIRATQEEEYKRLLYVAMTRAADRLYVAGYQGKRTPPPLSWHLMIEQGLRSLSDIEELPDGGLRIQNAQASGKGPDKPGIVHTATKSDSALPEWLRHNAPAEPAPARPLMPSRAADFDIPATSPLISAGQDRFRRGTLTHQLLQFLPGITQAARLESANAFLASFAQDLSESVRSSIAQETLSILSHPDFAPLFGPGSLAEVPVSGLLSDGRIISGQIDRLLITDTDILIIDYKTNRPPPQSMADVPSAYRRQLEAYADALRQIYPGRRIKGALLWTDGPLLMPLI